MISPKKNNFIVEFRPSTIRAARISSEMAPTVLEGVLEVDLKTDPNPANTIREFARAKANSNMQANCAVYPQGRLVRQVMLDTGRGREVDFVMNYLRETAGVNPDDFAVHCVSAEDGRDIELSAFNKKEILICGASKPEISSVQNALVENGVYPRRLELGTIGTIGVLKDLIGEEAGRSPVLFLEVDQDSTSAVIVGPRGVEMARRIECGSTHIAEALKEEMNLKDEAAAEKILKSRDFDLGPIAPKLLRRLLRELQSSIGFFEVQTGSSVSELYCLKDGRSLPWLDDSICDLLNLSPFRFDLVVWLESKGITIVDESLLQKMDSSWVSLMALAAGFGGEEAN